MFTLNNHMSYLGILHHCQRYDEVKLSTVEILKIFLAKQPFVVKEHTHTQKKKILNKQPHPK